jgi:hypothetical protein
MIPAIHNDNFYRYRRLDTASDIVGTLCGKRGTRNICISFCYIRDYAMQIQGGFHFSFKY